MSSSTSESTDLSTGNPGAAGTFGERLQSMWFVESAERPQGVTTRFPYVPALDGIRGLLVFPVLLFHFTLIGCTQGGGCSATILAPGSFFAPSMFFTLSGFLITSLLLIERGGKGRVDWLAFWSRRFRRLLPASVVVVLVCAALPHMWPAAWGRLFPSDALAALFSFRNWQAISLETTQGLRTVGPLSPYWSLAIEEQFYLGLSIVVGVAMLARSWRTTLTVALAATGAASIFAMLVVHGTPNRELFGTDIRAAEVVAGCLLAVAVQKWGWPQSRWFVPLGWIGLAGTVILWGWVSEHDPWVLNGGLILIAVLNLMIIVGASVWGGSIGRFFCSRPLVEIGKLSYPLYLVHWPVALATMPVHTGLDGWPLTLLRFGLCLLLAVPLTKFIEAPIRSRRILKGWKFPAVWAGAVAVSIGLSLWG